MNKKQTKINDQLKQLKEKKMQDIKSKDVLNTNKQTNMTIKKQNRKLVSFLSN